MKRLTSDSGANVEVLWMFHLRIKSSESATGHEPFVPPPPPSASCRFVRFQGLWV
jgi:hypothetical protein